MADNLVIDYAEYFHLPTPPPTLNKDCIAKCKLCGHVCDFDVFTLTDFIIVQYFKLLLC